MHQSATYRADKSKSDCQHYIAYERLLASGQQDYDEFHVVKKLGTAARRLIRMTEAIAIIVMDSNTTAGGIVLIASIFSSPPVMEIIEAFQGTLGQV